ncbi:hypothetical protein NE579_15975, partial [Intestinimonas massiliensis]|nr:hypothetical protein [Intestinimonas massiliensis (ex Afouda et al. 2020)]
KAWLDGRGVGCDTRDIKLEHPGEDELRKWHAFAFWQVEHLGYHTNSICHSPFVFYHVAETV